MSLTQSECKLKAALAARTNTDAADWYPVFQARYGMLAAFRALRAEAGAGSVVTQLFTCCTAVTPILAAGLEPIYADISPRSASIDTSRLHLPRDARAVMLQHTFGIVDAEGAGALADMVHEAGVPVLEDCAHCVGRLARDADDSPLADLSFHSFGVEKMIDGTHFGGAVWVNPASSFAPLVARVRAQLEALPAPGVHLRALVRAYRVENGVLTHVPGSLSGALRRGLAAAGLFEPAVSSAELRGTLPHEPMRAGGWVAGSALAGMACLDACEERRRQTVTAYRAAFAGMPGVSVLPAAMEGEPQPLLRFPIFLTDAASADRALDAVRAEGLYAQAWYRPELGPGVDDPAAYRVPTDRSALPVCTRMSQTVVALPADVGEQGARRAADAVCAVVSS